MSSNRKILAHFVLHVKFFVALKIILPYKAESSVECVSMGVYNLLSILMLLNIRLDIPANMK
jgi:hypothetical protein